MADHSRAICFLIADGVLPHNEGAGYVLRRLIRRALYYSHKLNSKKNLLQTGTQENLLLLSQVYPELKKEKESIESLISAETERFFSSLKKGKKKLEEQASSLPSRFIDEKTVWNLYSTYGFPSDLTTLIAKEKGWSIASQEEIQNYKTSFLKEESLPPVQNIKTKLEKQLPVIIKSKTLFTGYEKDNETGKLTAIVKNQDSKLLFPKLLQEGEEGFLIFDQTCFYPESGGPLGDRGKIKSLKGQAEVLDCFKSADLLVHHVKVLKGRLNTEELYNLKVYQKYRKGIKSHHTATHLLNSALREVLGIHIKQAGSLVESCLLRFDFTHPQALTLKQIQNIEKKLLTHIEKEEAVTAFYKSFKSAQKENYLYLQGENYPEKVRVLKIGENISKELCGGIHVKNTQELQAFKIIKEEGVGSGVRRITAYTHTSLKAWEEFLVNQNLELRAFLKLPANHSFKQIKKKGRALWKGIIEKENPFLSTLKNKEKEIKKIKQQIIRWEADQKTNSPDIRKTDNQEIQNLFHPLAQQVLTLREFLKFPLPQLKKGLNCSLNPEFTEEPATKDPKNLPLDFLKKREKELMYFTNKKKELHEMNLTLSSLQKHIKSFSLKNFNIHYLIVLTPLEDRKILSDMSDFLLLKLKLSLVIIVGQAEEKHPIFINTGKTARSILSAGEILKDRIAPLCDGKGGGKTGFAQGSIKNRNKILELDPGLIFKDK